MHIESVTLRNFRCFDEDGVTVHLASDLTAFIGSNGTGKTAVSQALQRVFGISADERTIRLEDFHTADADNADVPTRSLSIEVILALPELDEEDGDVEAVPAFFRHMTAEREGNFKCRLVLTATWTRDATVDGNVETRLVAVTTLDADYTPEDTRTVTASERSRIQFVYVPAARDGAREVTSFLRGRLWRAARWSETLRELVANTAKTIGDQFHEETATQVIESAFGTRWRELHGAGTHATPRFEAIAPDVDQFLTGTELSFEPDHNRPSRPAKLLSDGQRAILHLALVTASLDVEGTLRTPDAASGFELDAAVLPALTIIAVEEPENNLAPFYLSRIVRQFLELGATPRVQTLMSSHSASALTRIEPTNVRHFRTDPKTGASAVRQITLPENDDDAAAYVRGAVRAHPEVYFSRFVILGEGESEQIVLPAVARAMNIDLDPAFIAMVPLGGRHTKHFWTLLRDLGIPHATLLDFDYGRAGGGAGRIRDAFRNLVSAGVDAFEGFDGYESVDDVPQDITADTCIPFVNQLRRFGVFFSGPLDLDMMMMQRYRDAYQHIPSGGMGPTASDASEAVLGTGGTVEARAFWGAGTMAPAEPNASDLRWYRYLFSNRSKPSTHLRALHRIAPNELALPPVQLQHLIEFVDASTGQP